MSSLSCGRSLYNNQIGDQGATAIAEAMKVNGALTELFLQGNGIGDQGATTIAEALKFNGALKLQKLFVGSPLRQHARNIESSMRRKGCEVGLIERECAKLLIARLCVVSFCAV